MPQGTPPPHLRVSAIGTLGDSEIFQFSVSMSKADGPPIWNPLGGLQPNDAVWDDIAKDVGDFFGRSATRIHQSAVLRSVKVASIGANGLYDAPPVERSLGQSFGNVQVGGSGGVPGVNNGSRPPFQQALAVTLHTAGDNNKVKGRFYLPMPVLSVDGSGRISSADADDIESSARTFIEALNNAPGIDVLQMQVVVASGGTRNSDGSVRTGPQNHAVTGISVGRRPDVIRRRGNKVRELRTMVGVADPGQ